MAPLKVSCRHALVVGLVLVCLAITASRWLARDVRAQEQLPSTVSSLTKALHDKDPGRRVEAARALAAMGPSAKDAIPALIKALNDEVADVGNYAAGALWSIGAPAVPALREAIQNESEVVRLHAAHALSNIGSAAGAATPALIGALNDESARVREKAAEALTRIGPPAVSSLIAALENDHERVRSGAAQALGQIGLPARDAVPTLSKALREDDSEDVRANCARALGQMGPEAYAAVPVLRKALSGDASVKVRQAAAVALGKMGPPAKDAVPELIKALADQRQFRGAPEGVYPYAAVALGQIGAAAQTVIPSLVEAMTRARYPDDRDRAAEALERIAQDLQDQAETLSISQLQHVITMLNKALKDLQGQAPPGVRRAVQALEAIHRVQQGDPINRVLQWLAKNPWAAGMAIYVVCALGLWFGMLWLRPLWLLKINELVKPYTDVALPAWLGGIKVPVSLVLLVGFFHYHPRVLDAWVAAHLGAVRERFARKDTVRGRRVHIPVPVVLDGHTVSTLTGKDLQSTFGRGLGCLLIWGEGGAGKTSLACQVARWAMAEEPDQRPCHHRMIPVLIEHDLDFAVASGKDSLTAAIGRQLQDLIAAPTPIPEALLEHLLRHRRILVIVDHLSEMPRATRDKIQPEAPHFPANALIVTSRIEETLGGVTRTISKPLRVAGNRLASFMEAYLMQRQKRDLFDDPAFFDACSGLSTMAGQRDITVLLAKLYAEHMIAAKEGGGEARLPENIPHLMLSYLNTLNRGVSEGKLDDRIVHRDAKAIAWECLKHSYRPAPARLEQVLAGMGGEDAAARLKYLEERLHLVQTMQPAQDSIRIVLDPLTEYLAGLYLVEQYGTSEAAWRAFLADTDAKTKDGTREASIGFLLAVRDGCLARRDDISTPGFVPDELAKRAGIQVPVQVSPEDFLSIVLQKGVKAGPLFNLQCHVSNANKEAVTIHKLEAYLTDPHETSFRLTWSLFYAGSTVMRKIADPHPITVPPEESHVLGIQFVGPASIAEYLWPEGRYGFDLRGWLTATQSPKPPDFTTPCALHVTTEDATNLQYWSAAGEAEWVALGDPDNAVAIPVAIARRSSSRSKI